MEKYPQYESLINGLNSDQTCLMVYSLDYRMKNDYVEYYCAINHDFDVPDNDENYNELWDVLEKESCTIRAKNCIILGGEID